MKFRFLNDRDCPDWILAAIISNLSVMNVNVFETLVSKAANTASGQEHDEDDKQFLHQNLEDDGKVALVALHVLLLAAIANDPDIKFFNEEIQQLGLPKDHAAAMCRVLGEYGEALRQRLIADSFKVNELESVELLETSADTINCATFEFNISHAAFTGYPTASKSSEATHILNIERANLKSLLKELKEVRRLMDISVTPKQS